MYSVEDQLGGVRVDGERYLWLVVGVARGGEAQMVRARALNRDLAVRIIQIMDELDSPFSLPVASP
jgi:hypothetical protein